MAPLQDEVSRLAKRLEAERLAGGSKDGVIPARIEMYLGDELIMDTAEPSPTNEELDRRIDRGLASTKRANPPVTKPPVAQRDDIPQSQPKSKPAVAELSTTPQAARRTGTSGVDRALRAISVALQVAGIITIVGGSAWLLNAARESVGDEQPTADVFRVWSEEQPHMMRSDVQFDSSAELKGPTEYTVMVHGGLLAALAGVGLLCAGRATRPSLRP